MSFKLRVLPLADRDLQSIFDFISEQSPEGAERWWNAFLDAATRATLHPEQYPFAAENVLVVQELRQFFFFSSKPVVAKNIGRFLRSLAMNC